MNNMNIHILTKPWKEEVMPETSLKLNILSRFKI